MLALRAVCRPGDTVAIESPIFYNLLQIIAETLDLKALEIPTNPRNGISLSALRYALEHNPVHACLVIPNFNNPLGLVHARRQQAGTGKAPRGSTTSRSSKMTSTAISASMNAPARRNFDTRGLVIHCSSFPSATLAPGLPVGWVIPGRFMESDRKAEGGEQHRHSDPAAACDCRIFRHRRLRSIPTEDPGKSTAGRCR